MRYRFEIGKEVQDVLDGAEGDFATRSLEAIEQARKIMSRKPEKRAVQEGEMVQTLINNAPRLNSSYEGILQAFHATHADSSDEVTFEGSQSGRLLLLGEDHDIDLLDVPVPERLFEDTPSTEEEFMSRQELINATLNQSFEHIVLNNK